jgi:O-antigen ligase
MRRLALPLALIGMSVATGVGIAMIPPSTSTRTVMSRGLLLAAGLIVVVIVAWALSQFGHRAVASVSLYACALGLALPGVRVTGWMTASDLFLLLAAGLLIPEIPKFRLRSSVERGFALAVMLIVIGGLLGTIAAEDTQLSLLNLVRLVVAAGATLMTFALWAPSTVELRRFLILVVLSGLVTGLWAMMHAGSDFGRPSGFSGHPNHLALVSLVALGPAIGYSLVRGSHPAARIMAVGATAVLVGAIIVTGSRAGLLGVIVAALLAVFLVRDITTRAQFVVVAATIAVAALLGFSALTPDNAIVRTFNAQSASAALSDQGRRIGFSEMADKIRRKPITGAGFSDPLGGHDAYLQLWAAGGIVAFFGGILLIASGRGAIARLRRLVPPRSVYEQTWPLLASTISLTGLMVALVFQNGLWNRYIWVTVALVAVSSRLVETRQAEGPP